MDDDDKTDVDVTVTAFKAKDELEALHVLVGSFCDNSEICFVMVASYDGQAMIHANVDPTAAKEMLNEALKKFTKGVH